MRLNFENKTKLIALAFALTVGAIIAGTIFPAARDIRNINRATLDLKTYLEKKYENALDLRQSAKQIDEIRIHAADFSAALYHRGDELKLITFLENAAAKNNLTQTIQAPNLDKPEEQIVRFSLSLNGQYNDALNYLTDLETAPYFLTIRRLQISNAGNKVVGKTIIKNVSMDIDLQLYVAQ